MTEMLAWLSQYITPTEAVAAALGLACVWLYVRRHILCWPVGLAQTALYLYVFADARLLSDAGLQAVFIVLQVYGWWYWLRGGRDRAEPPVTRLTAAGWAWSAVAVALATLALGTLTRELGAALPYVDAFAAALSLTAQFLIGRKILESWLLWIVVDVVSIGMYLSRGLYVTTGLYAVFLVLAMRGYLAWRREPAPVLRPAAA